MRTCSHGNPCRSNNTSTIFKIQKLELNVCTDERYIALIRIPLLILGCLPFTKTIGHKVSDINIKQF